MLNRIQSTLRHGAETEHNTEQFMAAVKNYADRFGVLGAKRIGLYLNNGIDWLAVDTAARALKISCIPLPKFFSEEQLRHCCRQAQVDVLVSDESVNVFGHYFPIQRLHDGLTLMRHQSLKHQHPLRDSQGEVISKVTFTSGTTGQPKGVMLRQTVMDQVVESLASVLAPLALKKHLSILPLGVLLEDIAGARLCERLGGTLMVPDLEDIGLQGSSGMDVKKLATAIEHYQPHSMILLPQILRALTVLAEQKRLRTESFRFLAVGGGLVSPEWIVRARAAGLPVYEGYGLSECASVVALNTPAQDQVGSVGKVLPHQRLEVSERGEICVSGSGFSGYLGVNDVAAVKDNRVYTGDEGVVDEQGFVHIKGRLKNVLINGFGRNINPEWPEARLLECPHLLHAAVIGEGDVALSALLAGDLEHRLEIARHIEKINGELPDYARIVHWKLISPRQFASLNLLTTNGRIKRDELLRAYRITESFTGEKAS